MHRLTTLASIACLLAGCAAPPPSRVPLPADAAPYVAGGNEPFWSARVAGGELVFDEPGAPSVRAAVSGARPLFDGRRVEAGEFKLDALPGLCRDSMSGLPYPERVELQRAGRRLQGCGGDPAQLLAGEWRIVEIAGAPPAAGSTPTITFDTGTKRLAGSTGCNRFSAGYALSGEGLRLTPAVATRMGCPPPLAAQEQALLARLAGVVRHDIERDGSLVLYAGDAAAPVLRARRR